MKPLLAPCEIITNYAKQSGGHGQYGHVVFSMEPLERGNGVENKIIGGSIPKEYIRQWKRRQRPLNQALCWMPVTDGWCV
jgi:elongation factor G